MQAPKLDGERQAAVMQVIEQYHGSLRGILFGSWPSLARVAAAVLTEEEMESACLYGLCRAASRYNPAAGKLSSYAAWWIRNSVQQAIADARGVPRMNGRRWADETRALTPREDVTT